MLYVFSRILISMFSIFNNISTTSSFPAAHAANSDVPTSYEVERKNMLGDKSQLCVLLMLN